VRPRRPLDAATDGRARARPLRQLSRVGLRRVRGVRSRPRSDNDHAAPARAPIIGSVLAGPAAGRCRRDALAL